MSIDSIIRLRLLLEDMERDLGLDQVSSAEKMIYLAAQDVKSSDGFVQTKDMIEHKLTKGLSRPTFFGGLKAIQNKGLLKNSDRKKTGEFKV